MYQTWDTKNKQTTNSKQHIYIYTHIHTDTLKKKRTSCKEIVSSRFVLVLSHSSSLPIALAIVPLATSATISSFCLYPYREFPLRVSIYYLSNSHHISPSTPNPIVIRKKPNRHWISTRYRFHHTYVRRRMHACKLPIRSIRPPVIPRRPGSTRLKEKKEKKRRGKKGKRPRTCPSTYQTDRHIDRKGKRQDKTSGLERNKKT